MAPSAIWHGQEERASVTPTPRPQREKVMLGENHVSTEEGKVLFLIPTCAGMTVQGK